MPQIKKNHSNQKNHSNKKKSQLRQLGGAINPACPAASRAATTLYYPYASAYG
jgi:hypothetical protein